MSVVIETTLGDITVDLFYDQRPQTCNNFLKLCKTKYYNFCRFHFIQKDFIAQTGDPSGTGNGGESVYYQLHQDSGRFIRAEKKPKIKHERAGLISMVNNGEDLHGSQFFFTLSHSLDSLDGVHSVFGEVVEGLDVIDKLNDVICDESNRPYQDIFITHTVILDDPFPQIVDLIIPSSSPQHRLEEIMARSERIGVGEDIFDEDKPPEVIEEEIRDKESKQRALVLEMVGDIPDADVAPPENVLFVCKLNPVTCEEDLEIIFSRFGKIVSCEIIKDEQSGESLQYGFIEFDDKESCEKAYFKMDNVLIDDRRIHVDFSQSVSKLKWPRKGKTKTDVSRENLKTGSNDRNAQDKNRDSSHRDDRSRHDRHRERKRSRSRSPSREHKRKHKHRHEHSRPSSSSHRPHHSHHRRH